MWRYSCVGSVWYVWRHINQTQEAVRRSKSIKLHLTEKLEDDAAPKGFEISIYVISVGLMTVVVKEFLCASFVLCFSCSLILLFRWYSGQGFPNGAFSFLNYANFPTEFRAAAMRKRPRACINFLYAILLFGIPIYSVSPPGKKR